MQIELTESERGFLAEVLAIHVRLLADWGRTSMVWAISEKLGLIGKVRESLDRKSIGCPEPVKQNKVAGHLDTGSGA